MQGVADFGQQRDLRILGCLLLDVRFDAEAAVAPFDHVVHGHNDNEVDGGSDQEEVDDRRQQHAELDVIAVQGHHGEAVEVGRAHQAGDEGHEDTLNECRDHGAERSADDDCDGKVHDVALENETLESCQHVPKLAQPREHAVSRR